MNDYCIEMKISKTTLPEKSILNVSRKGYNYVDSFEGDLNDNDYKFNPVDIGKAFFTSSPKWVEKLMTLRDKVVSIFGLKISGDIADRKRQLDNFKCEPGEQIGPFKVFAKTESEVILGEDDKHLNFRISLFLNQKKEHNIKNLTISTTVDFNNWFGRLYFLIIRPFHKLIVPAMLKAVIIELEKRNE